MATEQQKKEVMRAALDGKDIEHTPLSLLPKRVWSIADGVNWDWFNFLYRVKPEPAKPREVYIEYRDGTPIVTGNAQWDPEAKLFREVLPTQYTGGYVVNGVKYPYVQDSNTRWESRWALQDLTNGDVFSVCRSLPEADFHKRVPFRDPHKLRVVKCWVEV